jgi:hypothetical protein
MKSFAEQRIKLKALFDKSEIPLSTKDLAILIKEKQILDKAIIKLAKKEKINFKLGENGFPSDAVKRARRQKYAEPFFNENKLNGKGASELLCHINILEKSII